MSKFSFILFHGLMMALIMAISVMGLFLLSWLFNALGALVILLGILIFFSGTTVNFIFDEFGNEYIVSNIRYRAIILVVTIILGASIAILPTMFEIPEIIIGFTLILLAVGLGFKVHGEDDGYKYYASDTAKLIGVLVPFVYMINAAVFIVAILFSWPLFISIVTTALCVLFHLCRTIYVCREL